MVKDFEQHLQTCVAACVLAVLLWGGVTLNTLQQDVAVLKADVRHVKEDVAYVKEASSNAYPMAQAAQDRIRALAIDQRVRKLEIILGRKYT